MKTARKFAAAATFLLTALLIAIASFAILQKRNKTSPAAGDRASVGHLPSAASSPSPPWWRRKDLIVLHGHTGPVNSIAFSPDASLLLSVGADQSVRLWDLASEKQTGFFSGHLDPTTPGFSGEEDHSVFFLQSGGRFVSLSHKMFVAGPDSLGVSGSLCLWDGLSSTPIKRISSLHSVGLCLPDGQRIAAASTPKGHVRLIDTTSFSMTDGLTLDFGNQPRLVGKIACSPDGNTIAATYGARVQNQYFLSYIIHCWNSHTGASLRELLTNVTCDGRAFTFGFTADSKSVVYMENARDVTIASASIPSSKPRLLATLPEGIHAKPGAFSSDGKHFALLYTPEQSAPRAWVAALKTPLQMHELSFREKPSSPTCCAFANESAAFALADDKGVIHILTLDPSAPERLPGAVEGGVRQTGDQNGGKALNDNM